MIVGCLHACFTSHQHASVSQGRICSDKCTCCHTEIENVGQTLCLAQPQYTDIGPTSPSAGPITPGGWQGSHWSINFEVTGIARSGKKDARRKRDSNPGLPLSRRTPLPIGQRGDGLRRRHIIKNGTVIAPYIREGFHFLIPIMPTAIADLPAGDYYFLLVLFCSELIEYLEWDR